MIICVRGVPGSGKTHIAKALRKRGVRWVIDTDDVVTEAYDELAKTKQPFTIDKVYARAQRKRTAARSNRSVDDHSRQRRARRPHRITPRHQHATRRNRSSVRLNNRKSNR